MTLKQDWTASLSEPEPEMEGANKLPLLLLAIHFHLPLYSGSAEKAKHLLAVWQLKQSNRVIQKMAPFL